MPGPILTTSARILCPHGGQAVLRTDNDTTRAGTDMLLETDVHDVYGCSFTVGPKYQPCTKIEWSAGADALTVRGTKVLVTSSVGTCKHEKVVQGFALIVSTQMKASAT